MSWWNSIVSMRRLAHGFTYATAVLFMLGAAACTVERNASIAALVLGAASLLCAMFSWFRLEHLRELDRGTRRPS